MNMNLEPESSSTNEVQQITGTVHLMLQGKGGVGKSLSAAFLAQYLKFKGCSVTCFDTDPINQTLMNYKTLNAKSINLMVGSRIDEGKFDALMDQILPTESNVIVDNGASSFVPMMNYLIENDVFNLLNEARKPVFIHCIVTGGQAMTETLIGLKALVSQAFGAKIIVWINEYFGPIIADGLQFEEMTVYKENKHRISGIVRIVQRTQDTFGADVSNMLNRNMTFDEVYQSEASVMVKQRIKMVQRAIFEQLDVLNSVV